MNVRNIMVALIALMLLLIIGSAVVVREVAPGLANNSTRTAGAAKAMTKQIAPAGGRERAVRSTRSAAIRKPSDRPSDAQLHW